MLKTKTLFLLIMALVVAQEGYTQSASGTKENDFMISKGRAYSSLTFSLNQRRAENEDQLLRQVIDQDRFNYRVVSNGGYAVQDNLTLGLLAGYGRSREEITYLDENGEEITSNRLQQGLSLSPNMRNYVPIGNGQLQILVQTALGVTIGESLQRVFLTDEIDKIEGDFVEIELGVSPGMILFFDRHWAFETTVGVAGFSTRIEEEITNDNGDNRQRVVESAIDLRINLLQLNLGVAYYF